MRRHRRWRRSCPPSPDRLDACRRDDESAAVRRGAGHTGPFRETPERSQRHRLAVRQRRGAFGGVAHARLTRTRCDGSAVVHRRRLGRLENLAIHRIGTRPPAGVDLAVDPVRRRVEPAECADLWANRGVCRRDRQRDGRTGGHRQCGGGEPSPVASTIGGLWHGYTIADAVPLCRRIAAVAGRR